MTADSAVQVKTFGATFGAALDITQAGNQKGTGNMRTQVSTGVMTRREKIAGWSFGAAVVIVLPLLIAVAHATSGS